MPIVFDPQGATSIHSAFEDPLGRHPDDYPKLGPDDVDAFVQNQIAGTGGNLYRDVPLRTYPTPKFPVDRLSPDATLLDVGAGWGRWSMAAAIEGWTVWAVDPWLDCCRALARVAAQRELDRGLRIANGEGQRLPFASASFDCAFSYSVIQHLSKPNAVITLEEMVRVVKPGGTVLVQMPNVRGLRQRYLQRRGIVVDTEFNVRPWRLEELRDVISSLNPRDYAITADGFLSLNAQWSERRALPRSRQVLVGVSEAIRRASKGLTFLTEFADSVWIRIQV